MRYPYIVTGWSDDFGGTRTQFNRGDRDNVDCFYDAQAGLRECTLDQVMNLNGEWPVYAARTEEEANTIAEYLTTKRPTLIWTVSKVSTIWGSVIAPPTAKTLTDKGVLPF